MSIYIVEIRDQMVGANLTSNLKKLLYSLTNTQRISALKIKAAYIYYKN